MPIHDLLCFCLTRAVQSIGSAGWRLRQQWVFPAIISSNIYSNSLHLHREGKLLFIVSQVIKALFLLCVGVPFFFLYSSFRLEFLPAFLWGHWFFLLPYLGHCASGEILISNCFPLLKLHSLSSFSGWHFHFWVFTYTLLSKPLNNFFSIFSLFTQSANIDLVGRRLWGWADLSVNLGTDPFVLIS